MNPKILVIGESCLDVFIYCDAKRLCPDIPAPVLNILDKNSNPGMAANVHRNISNYMDCDLFTNENWANISKTRYMHLDSNYLFIRVDSPHDIDRIDLGKINYNYDIIIISDYNKGFLKEGDIQLICEKHSLVFLDTKKILGNWASKAAFIKINNYEYESSLDKIDSELFGKIIHTKGADGCYFRGVNYPVEKVEVKDTSGAGDSFLSALVVKFFETRDIEKSIIFANEKASQVVSKRGVTTI